MIYPITHGAAPIVIRANRNLSCGGCDKTNLLANWRFNGDVTDETGTYNGTNSGCSFDATTKKLGSHAIYGDGTDDEVSVSGLTSLSGDWTIEFWIYLADTSTRCDIFSMIGGTKSIEIMTNYSTGILGVWTTDNGWIIFSDAISATTWVHVALVKSGTSLTLYLDGTADSGGSKTIADVSYEDTCRIVGRNDGSHAAKHHIDEMRIWSEARTQAQINAWKDTEI